MSRHGDHSPPVAERPAHNGQLRPANDQRPHHLEALAAKVESGAGLRAHVVSPPGTVLHVVNPLATVMCVDVGCELLNGEWWFTWDLSRDGTLGPANDPDGAVSVINKVLRADK